jgi:hypothetical protein
MLRSTYDVLTKAKMADLKKLRDDIRQIAWPICHGPFYYRVEIREDGIIAFRFEDHRLALGFNMDCCLNGIEVIIGVE